MYLRRPGCACRLPAIVSQYRADLDKSLAAWDSERTELISRHTVEVWMVVKAWALSMVVVVVC